MKREFTLKAGQYAYTTDGRVIQIHEILENGEKYRGVDLKEAGNPEVELDKADIYCVAFGFGKAG